MPAPDEVTPERLDRMRRRQDRLAELTVVEQLEPDEVERAMHAEFPETRAKRIIVHGPGILEFRGPSDWSVIGL